MLHRILQAPGAGFASTPDDVHYKASPLFCPGRHRKPSDRLILVRNPQFLSSREGHR